MNKLSQSAMIAHLIYYSISPYWVENARGGMDVFFKLSLLWHFLKLFYFHFEMVFTPKSDLIKKS